MPRKLPIRSPRDWPRSRRVRALTIVSILAALTPLVACGSHVDPEDVARAQGIVPPGTVQGDETVVGTSPQNPGDPVSGDLPALPGSDQAPTDPGVDPGTPGDATKPDKEQAATGDQKAGSCEGFDNDQPGITSDKIVIANVADIAGPVPGMFEPAQQATRAFVEYFNSTSTICDHKIELKLLDSRTDAGADQQAYATACDEAFAAVGSMSGIDSGGAATAESCGLPDIRSTSVTPARIQCTTCFATQSVTVSQVPRAVPDWFTKHYKDATQHVGVFYTDSPAAVANAESWRAAWTKAGWNIDVFSGIDVAQFNFAPLVQQMKDEGIKMVTYIGPYQFTVRLQQAMQQAQYTPDVYFQDASIYDQRYVDQAGSLGDGSFVYLTTDLLDNYKNKEMALYRAWLDQVSPGAIPNYYGLYAWSAARLFVEQAAQLGGKLTRASMVQALRGVKDWTGNGLHVPQQVGAKATANCASIIQLNDGKWRKLSGFECGPLINSGTGG